ncbi:mechanosensitive ion channel [Candidatus Peregrinibacteria bacterium]|nr:mechanosensitive ion channel [Candidatus Peregrinibacteria bacterium]
MATTVPGSVNVNSDGVNSGSSLDFENLLPQILEKFLLVLEGAIIIAVSVFLIAIIRGKIRKFETLHEQQRTALNLLEKITSGFLLVTGVTIALKVIGIDMTLMVSVAILGLSYGLQDIIKNYVAGILILFKSPFKIGDTIKIKEYTGKVAKIDFQSTTLSTFDNKDVTIYNSDVMTQSIINFSNNTVRRIDFDVTVGYASDMPKALQVFDKILANYPAVLKLPKHAITFKKFSDMGAVFSLRFWIQRPCNILRIRTDIASMIAQAFDEQNIYMPFGKGIETENEAALGNVSDMRKQRIQNFYGQPIFTQVDAPEQPGQEPPVDFDEPEA